MKFEFKAFTPTGELKSGVIDAKDKETALKILQDQNLLVTFLEEKKLTFKILTRKPKLSEVYIFTQQLSYLLKARTPLDDAIKALSENTTNYNFKSILIEIYNDLLSGLSFSQSLLKFTDVFNYYYIGMVRIGETVGSLDEVLEYLANHLYALIRFKNRITQALIYPLMVILIFIGVFITILYFVVPQITKIFIDNNLQMPTITKILNALANFLSSFGIFLLIIVGSFIYFFYQYIKTKEGRAFFINFISNIPFLGEIIKNSYSTQFLESLFYLLKGGVPLIEALDIIKKSIDNPFYESALENVIEDIKKGVHLSEALSKFPNVFPNIIIEGIKTSEKTGQLTEIILTIYNFYTETSESQAAKLSEVIQPVLIVILAIGLGLLQASLLLPLLNLTKQVQAF